MSKQQDLMSGYEEIKEGEIEETEIVEVQPGVLGDFKSKEYWDKVDSEKREAAKLQPAVQIHCKNGSKMEIPLPPNKKYGPKSTLAAWMKTYRKFPEQGMKVITERDEGGWFRIQLKQLR